ncbi:MAG: mechanosensitive ion channel [Lentisphaeria bacterium]|nr:mechanosensitive ion channel [Lentisphaeria bacterium]
MREFLEKLWQMILDSNLLNLVGGIGILLIGWLIALWASRRVSCSIRKWSAKHTVTADGSVCPPGVNHADTAAGRIVYYTILIFAVLGCFSVLDLDAAAEPLKNFISAVILYIPNIIGALLLVLAARIVAGIVRGTVRMALLKSKLHERLAGQLQMGDPEKFADYTAKTLYYTVFLFFLPAILNVLKIYGITEPLQAMFEKVMIFLPRMVVAAILLSIGLWAAKVIRRAVAGLVVISRLDALGEKAGISRIFGNGGLAEMLGIVIYTLVAIPVVISALTALQIDSLSRSVAGFLDKLLNGTGDIIGAGIILFAAVLAGGFAASLVKQLSANFGVDKLASEMGCKSCGEGGRKFSCILGKLTFLVILVLALLAVCDTLQFTALAKLIREFAVFGGNVLVSIVVMLIGIWLANIAASAVKDYGNNWLTTAVRLTVIIFTAAVALGNMDIGGVIVELAFALILGAVCVALAIAFGIGGREAAANLLKKWMDKL